jgi:hypothetical protein
MMTDAKKIEPLSITLELDHLANLADDRWREYENKSQAEWKLSYSVWATLLAAIGTLLTKNHYVLACSFVLVLIAIVFVALAFIVHWWFLDWVHEKLGSLRNEMSVILNKRRKLLNIQNFNQIDTKSGREALHVQLSITVLLGALLVGAAFLAPT